MQLINNKQRLLNALGILAILVVLLFWRSYQQQQKIESVNLPPAINNMSMEFVGFSDKSFSYRILLLWIQQFDVQAGKYISYRELDYPNLINWLKVISTLEPSSQYPLLLATRIYTKVADGNKKRLMLNYVYQAFIQNPEKNWRWLSEASLIAMHHLKNLPLALQYATALAESKANNIPHWARDTRLLILENMGEFQQVEILVGGLLADKTIVDENEIRFLELLLQRLQKNHNYRYQNQD